MLGDGSDSKVPRENLPPFPALSPWVNHAEPKGSQGSAGKGKTICSGALESDAQHAGLVGFFSFNQHQVDLILRDADKSRISTGSSHQTPLALPWSRPFPCPPEGRLAPGWWTTAPDPVIGIRLHAATGGSGRQQCCFPFQSCQVGCCLFFFFFSPPLSSFVEFHFSEN